MQQWKLTLAYDGTSFHGWQVQPGLPTVQGTLAAALRRITGETVLPQGSGRTDTGVHALAQVASLALAAPIPPANLLRALNRALPPAIRILSAQHASPGFHARHCAFAKTYEYRIFSQALPGEVIPTEASRKRRAAERPPNLALSSPPDPRICPPFLAPYVWDCPWPLDLVLARRAAPLILGTHDFTSFAAADPDLATRAVAAPDQLKIDPAIHNLRTIHHSAWTREDGLLIYRVTGSGFLHHMVRNLVGTFVEIAIGRLAPDALPHILAARSRAAAGPTAPARGLFLVSVDYPDHNLGAPPLASEMWDDKALLSKVNP